MASTPAKPPSSSITNHQWPSTACSTHTWMVTGSPLTCVVVTSQTGGLMQTKHVSGGNSTPRSAAARSTGLLIMGFLSSAGMAQCLVAAANRHQAGGSAHLVERGDAALQVLLGDVGAVVLQGMQRVHQQAAVGLGHLGQAPPLGADVGQRMEQGVDRLSRLDHYGGVTHHATSARVRRRWGVRWTWCPARQAYPDPIPGAPTV